MQTVVDQDDNLEFLSKTIQKKDNQEFNDKNEQLEEASFEQFTEKYIQDHIEELSQKKEELLLKQEMKIKEIKVIYSTKLEELDQALQLLTSLQTTTTPAIKPLKSKQQPNQKLKQPLGNNNNNNNEIMLDLSSINLPFEFTPTVPFKLNSAKKQDFKLVKTEGTDANLYEPKNSDQYLKLNIQQQLDLGRFTPFVFQPNLKK